MSLLQEGYLFKRGDLVKRWNLRYFMLFVGSQPTLVYYRKVGEAPANALSLVGAKVQLSGTAKGGSLFQFTVQASGETYELAAPTQQERRRWVDQLEQATPVPKQTIAAQSVDGTGASGHLLAPSPLGIRQASEELRRGSPPPSPLGRRPSLTQEGTSPFRPQSFRKDLDQPSAQPPSQSLAQRAGQPMGSGSPFGQRSGQLVGSSSPTAQKATQPAGSSSPAGQRFGQLLGSRSPSKGDNAARLARMGYTESLRGSENDSLRSFSMRSSSGNVKRSLLASLSASFRNAIVPPHPSDMASSLSDTESVDTLGLVPSSPYTASLQPLKGQGQEPPKAAMLASDALMEQFERSQQYVARHPEDFSLERLSSLQDWCDAAKSKGRSTDAGLAASAMYVLQVTQTSPMWASEHDTAFISPDGMIRSVQSCPSASMLTDLKDCLDFCSNSWVSLFCRQGGTALLLQALEVHANAGGEAEGHEAMLVTLQCMHALMSGAGGMHAVMSTCGFLPAVCTMLALPQESEAAKLVVEMLIKLSLFSAKGYTLAVKTLMGRLAPVEEPPRQHPASAPAAVMERTSSAAAPARAAPTPRPPPPRPPGSAQKPSSVARPPPSPPPPPPARPPGSAQKPSPAARPPPCPPPPQTPGSLQKPSPIAFPPPPPPPPPPPKREGSGLKSAAPKLAIPVSPGLPAPLQDSASAQRSSPAGAAAQLPLAAPPTEEDASSSQPAQYSALSQAQAQGAEGSSSSPGSGRAHAAVEESSPGDAGKDAPEYCTAILTLLKVCFKVTADMELADHLLSFLNAALSSPEAQHALPLRKAFVNTLLDLGLLNVLADISGELDTYLDASVHLLRANVKEVIAVPKAEPLPAPQLAPPAPPPPRSAKPFAPPPPPPPGRRKGPVKPLVPAKPRVDPGPKPSKKLKAFFWDVLPENRVPGTFWEANGPAYSSLDTQEVEALFQAAQAKKVAEKKAATKQLAILDVKRATGIGIRMAGLRAPWSRMADAVKMLDTRVFSSAEDARAVLACVPAAEERKMFDSFLRSGGKAEALSDAERFCLELMQVSRIEERLSTYASSFEAAQQLGEVEEVLTVHTAAQAELRASECFRTVLVRALALGNFLNWGGRLGQAPGFRLKNLPKLQDTRTADGRNNMLRYLAKRLVSEEPPQAVLSTQVPHVLSAPLKTSLQEAGEMQERASLALSQIRSELQKAGPSARLQLTVQSGSSAPRVQVVLQCDSYSDVMATSAQSLSKSLAFIKEQLQGARSGFEALVAYFGENSGAFQNDGDFWRDVTTFVAAFSAAQQDALAFEQEQQLRLSRQQARSNSTPAGAKRPSRTLSQAQPKAPPEMKQAPSGNTQAQPRVAAEASAAAKQASAPAEPQQRIPHSAVPLTSKSNVTAKQEALSEPGTPVAKAEAEGLTGTPKRQSHQNATESRLSGIRKAAASRKTDATGVIPMHADSISSHIVNAEAPSQQLLQKLDPHLASMRGIEPVRKAADLIQAVPEMPDRKSSVGWPESRKGLPAVLSPTQGSLFDLPDDPAVGTGEGITDSANEADLEALLGQLVNRAEHI